MSAIFLEIIFPIKSRNSVRPIRIFTSAWCYTCDFIDGFDDCFEASPMVRYNRLRIQYQHALNPEQWAYYHSSFISNGQFIIHFHHLKSSITVYTSSEDGLKSLLLSCIFESATRFEQDKSGASSGSIGSEVPFSSIHASTGKIFHHVCILASKL